MKRPVDAPISRRALQEVGTEVPSSARGAQPAGRPEALARIALGRPAALVLAALRRVFAAAAAGFAVLALLAAMGWRWNWTPSLSPGPYRIVAGPVVRGSLVMGCLPRSLAAYAIARGYLAGDGGPCPLGTMPIGKRMVGVPGDAFQVTSSGVYVGGGKVGGPAWTRDHRGRPLPTAGAGIVPAGAAFLVGDAASSWDSRYFGPIRLSREQRVVFCGGSIGALVGCVFGR